MLQKIQKIILLALTGGVLVPGLAFAQYTSPNYRVEESLFGAGGELDAASNNYEARASLGELGVGNTASANFQAFAGFNTTNEPMLEVFVSGGTFDMGYVEPDSLKAVTANFTVRSYISAGYTVHLDGTPPKNRDGGHILAAMSSAAASSPGTEQFGVNLAANNVAPVGPFGAAPQQLPDSTFGFGEPTTDYDTANLFKFVEDEFIAQSLKSSGVTYYTLSMMANTSKNTPAGFYGTDLYVNVVPTF